LFPEPVKRGLELRQAKMVLADVMEDLQEHNIPFNRNVPVGMMVETPAAVMMIDRFVEEVDFLSIGTNDLIQYTLAVDRNNELVAPLYNELHPAVMKLIEYVIGECNKAGVVTSICGQAGSRPDVAKKLVAMGITSISANIDAVESVREMVARTEHGLILDAARKRMNE